MRRLVFALLLASQLAPAALAAQDSVRLRLQPPPNAAVSYRFVTQMWMSGPGMPDDTAPTMTMSARWSMVLLAARPDSFVFEMSRDSMAIVSAMMPSLPSERHVDTVEVSGRGMPRLTPERLRRDSVRLAGLAGNPMAGLGAGGSQPGLFAFPDRALAIGTTWGDTTLSRSDSTPAGPFNIRMRLSHRLDRIVQDGERRLAVITSSSWMEMTMDRGQALFSGTGTTEVDLATGLIVRGSETSEGTMEMAGMSMPIRTRMSLVRLP